MPCPSRKKTTTINPKRLIIISDLLGYPNQEMSDKIRNHLSAYSSYAYYDARQIGGVSSNYQKKDEIHAAFIKGGIQRAID